MSLSERTASVSVAMSQPVNQRTQLPPTDAPSSARREMAGMDVGMRVLSYLIAGVLLYGGLGWLGDHYLGTRFLLPVGIVLGAAGGCYVIIRRYGQVPELQTPTAGPAVAPGDQTTTDTQTEGAR
jgi:F0F1-type ATP synthase assembly protein I